MNWSAIGEKVADAAPVLGTALLGPAGGAVGGILASVFGTENNPQDVAKAIEKDPDALLKLRQIEKDHEFRLSKLVLESESNRLETVNKTIRSEAASEDKFVRRWRPTYGYITALAWLLQTGGIAFAIIYTAVNPSEDSAAILNGVMQVTSALVVQWSVALSVLGVSVHKRSQDKQLMNGNPKQNSLIKNITNKILGDKDG